LTDLALESACREIVETEKFAPARSTYRRCHGAGSTEREP
jgi:hypothetical protein